MIVLQRKREAIEKIAKVGLNQAVKLYDSAFMIWKDQKRQQLRRELLMAFDILSNQEKE